MFLVILQYTTIIWITNYKNEIKLIYFYLLFYLVVHFICRILVLSIGRAEQNNTVRR